MKILVVDDEPDVREIISLLLQFQFKASITEAACAQKAIDILGRVNDFDCIICDYNMPDGSGEDVYRFMLESSIKIPFVLCSTKNAMEFEIFRKNPIYGSLIKPNISEGLKNLMAKLQKSDDIQTTEKTDDRFCSIRTMTAMSLGPLDCNLYIRLSGGRHIRIMRFGDVFDSNDLAKFDIKNIDRLYVTAADANKVLTFLIKQLKKTQSLAIEPLQTASVALGTRCLEIIDGFSRDLGFSPEIRATAKKCVEHAIQAIRKHPELRELYSRIEIDMNSHLASHSLALAHLSCGIAINLGWSSDLILHKLALAALLHDIMLHEDGLTKPQTIDEFIASYGAGSNDNMKLFLSHPETAAALVATFEDMPEDAELVIRQHHERPDGTGFPDRLTHANMDQHAAVLVFAEDMLFFKTRHDRQTHTSDFINSLTAEFYNGVFECITQSVTRALVKNTVS
ncbi:MAG: hypothetical protein A2583_11720 [Bdellovibrionales bacterium RIFOXYD1_FULL_53_11]|nr:MAG: hypothetical protein A2583_11720 [Bdellovibrionales bacterium RIFOXYD1_FULL_53_11]